MDQAISVSLEGLKSRDAAKQHAAFPALLGTTTVPVDWAYEVWDELLALLKTGDNRQRAIAAQVLCNLAKSDPGERILQALPLLLATTRDERFVTARHCMQSLWKVGVSGENQRTALVAGLKKRFKECAVEKNCTLIRYDILECIRRIYDAAPDEMLRSTALALIETEPDAKDKKKYLTLWRK